jgi:hypothetical protein
MTGLGLINFINARGYNRFDVIPVDIVTNSLIVTTAYSATQPRTMEVYNCGTSNVNPITMLGYKNSMIKNFQYHAFNRQALPVNLEFIENPTEFNVKKALFNEFPLKMLNLASKLPVVGTP